MKPASETGKSNDKYPAHKITTDNVYKISSIYGIKFNVMWHQLH